MWHTVCVLSSPATSPPSSRHLSLCLWLPAPYIHTTFCLGALLRSHNPLRLGAYELVISVCSQSGQGYLYVTYNNIPHPLIPHDKKLATKPDQKRTTFLKIVQNRTIARHCQCVTVCHCMSICVTHCMSMCVTVCHCVTACHCMSLYVHVCHCMSLYVTVCHYVSQCVTVCPCVSFTICPCVSLYVTVCHCMSLCVTGCQYMSMCVTHCMSMCVMSMSPVTTFVVNYYQTLSWH